MFGGGGGGLVKKKSLQRHEYPTCKEVQVIALRRSTRKTIPRYAYPEYFFQHYVFCSGDTSTPLGGAEDRTQAKNLGKPLIILTRARVKSIVYTPFKGVHPAERKSTNPASNFFRETPLARGG